MTFDMTLDFIHGNRFHKTAKQLSVSLKVIL